MPRAPTVALALGVVAHLSGCSAPPEERDADVDAALDAGTDADAGDADAGDADAGDADADTGAALTMVVNEVSLVTERLCDVDGDGDLDNAVGDIGAPLADLGAMALNSMIQGRITKGFRTIFHLPWVDDPSVPEDPDGVLLMLAARDPDDPADLTDDFSGTETYWAEGGTLDGCGEPRFAFLEASLADGVVVASAGDLPMNLDRIEVIIRSTAINGTIQPLGAGIEAYACGYALARDLGGQPGLEEAGDLTFLEDLLAGGTAFGVPMVPGLALDIDVDDDGLEQFMTDDVGHIEACVDGDTTAIWGRDCWQDERIADAFSLTARFSGVSAVFLGRAPDWELWAVGECTDPPEESLFDRR